MVILGYEITIKKRKRKVNSGFSRRPWTKSEIDTMLRLRNEGKSWAEVAKLMNRSKQSCTTRYYKVKNNGR